MNIKESTAKYEAWMAEHIPLIPKDLKQKHLLMREAIFPFFRATFYRWAQTWPEVCPDLQTAPDALAVGDLHVENFGTWRDIEGRLIWGINDFDEVYWLPYTCDLVRLASSAHLAIAAEHLRISPARVCEAILDGYRAALTSNGKAFVLAEHHPVLRKMAVERLKDPEPYWEKLNALPSIRRATSGALKALRRMLPDRELEYRIAHRVAGLGSLGRRRYVALAQWHGATTAREAKELAPSAWAWARGTVKFGILYQNILDRAIRCPDPFVRVRGHWIVRRLAPDCSRIELSSLPRNHDAARLLHCMGSETANVHLGSRTAKVLLADLKRRSPGWLHEASIAMTESVRNDWREWRKR